jgi:predicted GIY-YIG superfamily endonuclease
MLRCADGSYYGGSTSYDDIDIRVGEHDDGRFEGYISKRRPVVLVWAEQFGDLRDAQECERRIKGWRREKKEALIGRDWSALKVPAKRPSARRPSRLAALAPQGDALLETQTDSANRHPEVAAKRPSKGDGSI